MTTIPAKAFAVYSSWARARAHANLCKFGEFICASDHFLSMYITRICEHTLSRISNVDGVFFFLHHRCILVSLTYVFVQLLPLLSIACAFFPNSHIWISRFFLGFFANIRCLLRLLLWLIEGFFFRSIGHRCRPLHLLIMINVKCDSKLCFVSI